jgi:trimethylamine corrinoid protein
MTVPVEVGRASRELEQALLDVDRVRARRAIACFDGASRLEMIERLVVPALERIGEGWEAGTVSLSQVYMSGRICENLIDSLISPAESRRSSPRLAIAVLGDEHQLGKRIVCSVLRASGYEVADYGAGLISADLARRALADGVRILLISTLMLRSALRVREVVDALRGKRVRIVVGGAPFRLDEDLWREVGADACGHDAASVIAIVKRLSAEIAAENG